jgi:hypothetical protein
MRCFDYRDFDASDHPRASRAGLADVRAPDAHARALQRLLALFQMTALGAPMLYYGDEAGLWGANDPCCRKPMLWPEPRFDAEATHPDGTPRAAADPAGFDAGLHAWYHRAMALRRALPVLREGRVHTLLADDALAWWPSIAARSGKRSNWQCQRTGPGPMHETAAPHRCRGQAGWNCGLPACPVPCCRPFKPPPLQPAAPAPVPGPAHQRHSRPWP